MLIIFLFLPEKVLLSQLMPLKRQGSKIIVMLWPSSLCKALALKSSCLCTPSATQIHFICSPTLADAVVCVCQRTMHTLLYIVPEAQWAMSRQKCGDCKEDELSHQHFYSPTACFLLWQAHYIPDSDLL